MPKTILITGVSTGIGLQTAKLLVKTGFNVLGTVRSEQDAARVEAEIGIGEGSQFKPILLDVAKPQSIEKFVVTLQAALHSLGGELHGLVNNSGIVVSGPIEFLNVSEFRRQFDVNFFGLIELTQKLIPMLRKTQGHIVNISSESGHVAFPFLSPYCASKFALEALSDSLRIELQSFGIRVVLVEPGPIKTAIWDKSTNDALNMKNSMTPDAMKLYGTKVEKMFSLSQKIAARAISAMEVSKVVLKSLQSSKPKARYAVGTQAKANILLAKLLPDWLFDKLKLKLLS